LAQLHAMTATETARPGGPELYDLRYMRMWTKLRPGARALLAGAAPLAEIMVYTMGDRAYAVEMARLLDPGGALLRRGRLISAPDSRTAGSKDLDIVLGSAPGVLILDDTPAVWKRHAANVIVADRYHFFPASSRGHGADPTRSCLARSTDEDEGDGVMTALLRVVREVHASFFDGVADDADAQQRDVRPILAALRAKVLAGCIIVFSHGTYIKLSALVRFGLTHALRSLSDG
jgi:RNA polymerase II C-terminal domain phosphatase-like 3/4